MMINVIGQYLIANFNKPTRISRPKMNPITIQTNNNNTANAK